MHHAVFYEFHDAEPATDRFTHKTANGSVTIVLVGEPSKIPAAATELADAGIKLVELCGGFSDETASEVIEAVAGRSAVGMSEFGTSCSH